MTRSLVVCLVIAIAAGLAAAVAALAAGLGPLVAFGLYSAIGSCTLATVATLAAHLPRRPEPVRAPAESFA